MKYIVIYFITLVILLALDFLWLGVLSRNFYKANIGHLMSENIKILPVIFFYTIYPIAIMVFSLVPGLKDENIARTLILAAFLGFISYGTYNFTNLATLKDWPFKVLLVDITWGTFVTTFTTLISYFISKSLF
jgi:uncharacterized membrane protein